MTLVIRGGTIVDQLGRRRADVLIDGFVIELLLQPGILTDGFCCKQFGLTQSE